MDLSKISYNEVNFQVEITNRDITTLARFGRVAERYFGGANTVFDISLYNLDSVEAYVGYTQYIPDEIRSDVIIVYKCSVTMSNGTSVEESFKSTGTVKLIKMEDLHGPLILSVKIKVGFYWGSGGEKFDNDNILTDVEDFIPICSHTVNHISDKDILLVSGQFSDITLNCKDNKKIKAHKCLLISSPYFSALMKDNVDWKDQSDISVGYNVEIMQTLLSFLYNGRIHANHIHDWQELYRASDFYQLDGLARHCQLQLMVRASREWTEITELFRFSKLYHALKLKRFLISLTRSMQVTN